MTEYAQALDAASLLNGAIFRRVARHAMTVEDPDEFAVWAEHARVGYESPPQQNVAAPGH